MALKGIPVTNEFPSYDFQTILDGTTFQFRFMFSVRKQRWIMNLFTAAGEELLMGAPVLVGIDLLSRSGGENFPLGPIFTIDPTGESRNPDRTNFGNEVLLLYIDEE
jgi:hypothetical protein